MTISGQPTHSTSAKHALNHEHAPCEVLMTVFMHCQFCSWSWKGLMLASWRLQELHGISVKSGYYEDPSLCDLKYRYHGMYVQYVPMYTSRLLSY